MTDTSQDNPFQTPAAALQDGPAVATGEPLYRLAAVGIATFFGTPVAGAWITGIGALIAIFLLGMFLPDSVPATPINIAAVFGMYHYAKQHTGGAIEQHAAQGGQFASNWRAFGVSLLFLLAVMAVVFGGAFVLALFGLI